MAMWQPDVNLLAAIYHYTDHSSKRPIIYHNQLQILEQFAEFQGYNVLDIYCDMSKLYYEHPEFNRLMNSRSKYNVFIVKDWYHLNKNTSHCIELMKKLYNEGILVDSLENGKFLPSEETPLNENLSVATYICRKDYKSLKAKDSILLEQDILSHFVSSETKWTIVKQYSDICYRQTDDELTELAELIPDHENYDLLLVSSFHDIHWRTAKFCSAREKLGLDIYSLKEGYLPYHSNLDFEKYLEDQKAIIAAQKPDNRERARSQQKIRLEKKILSQRDVVFGYDWNPNYGNSPGYISINIYEAAIVKKIFEYYAIYNMVPSEIHDKLLDIGIKRGQRTINSMIQDERYIGKFYIGKVTYEYDESTGQSKLINIPKKDWVLIDRPDLRIVDDELFAKAQDVRRQRRKKRGH